MTTRTGHTPVSVTHALGQANRYLAPPPASRPMAASPSPGIPMVIGPWNGSIEGRLVAELPLPRVTIRLPSRSLARASKLFTSWFTSASSIPLGADEWKESPSPLPSSYPSWYMDSCCAPSSPCTSTALRGRVGGRVSPPVRRVEGGVGERSFSHSGLQTLVGFVRLATLGFGSISQ